MNASLAAATFVALSVTIGHTLAGSKMYMKPFLAKETDEKVKATFLMIFHYITVYVALSTLFLGLIAFEILPLEQYRAVVTFIGLNYLGFAFVQFYFALTHQISKPLLTNFQWIFFIAIALLCFL